MQIVCLDFEGVIIPEIWVGLAEITGIDDLKLTTQEIADYDKLMKHRLSIMDQHKLTINDIQEVIENWNLLMALKPFLMRSESTFRS